MEHIYGRIFRSREPPYGADSWGHFWEQGAAIWSTFMGGFLGVGSRRMEQIQGSICGSREPPYEAD